MTDRLTDKERFCAFSQILMKATTENDLIISKLITLKKIQVSKSAHYSSNLLNKFKLPNVFF